MNGDFIIEINKGKQICRDDPVCVWIDVPPKMIMPCIPSFVNIKHCRLQFLFLIELCLGSLYDTTEMCDCFH